MFRRFAVAAVAAVALPLALAGCGDDSPSSGSSGGSTSGTNSGGSTGGDAVAWAEKVCQAVEDDVAALQQQPDVDMSDPAKARDNLVSYLGSLATGLGNMASGIKEAGDPPVAGGPEAVTKVTDALESAKTSVEEASSNLAKAPVDDPAAFQAAFTKVGEDLASLSDLEDPTKELEANQAIKDAFDQAPTCKKLDESGSSSSTPTS